MFRIVNRNIGCVYPKLTSRVLHVYAVPTIRCNIEKTFTRQFSQPINNDPIPNQKLNAKPNAKTIAKPIEKPNKLKSLMVQYGWIAIAFHTFLFVAVFILLYAIIELGFVNIHKLTEQLSKWISIDKEKLKNTGNVVTAYIFCISTGPLRTMITLSATPFIAKLLRRVPK